MSYGHRLTVTTVVTGLGSAVLLVAMLGIATGVVSPLRAQTVEVPRTRTFSGLVAPAFPYVRPEDAGLSSQKLEWLADEIVGWVANGELVGGELLVIKDEKAVFHEVYGWSDRERRRPMVRNSIFSIKSMSKPFTAMAVLMLAEEGRLSLDDRVSRFVPGFAGDRRTTIHHLLCHTSGFVGNHGLRDEDDFLSLRDWVESWAAEGPTEPFGEFNYSDFNYAALGYIVEKVSGVPIEAFTEERIIRPLDLVDTATGFSSDPVWRARLNPWYRWNERAGQYDLRWTADRQPWRFYAAAWGLFSTAMDYAKFMALWLRGGEWKTTRLLENETAENALRSHARTDESFAYGYGWFVDEVPSTKLRPFAHGGGDGTQAGAYPDDNAIVIFLTHSRWGPWVDGFWNRVDMSGVFDNRTGFGINAFMIWADDSVGEIEVPVEDLVRYHGIYVIAEPERDPPESLNVWEERGHLQIRKEKGGSRSGERFHLVPIGNDRFAVGRYDDGRLEAVEPDMVIRFVTGDSGRANELEVVEGGRVALSARARDPK